MFGLDHWFAHLSNGTALGLVAVAAILLGLRHASDPDHIAAVTTLIASGRERTTHAAAKLGLAWGAGHATSLFLFGLPIVLFRAFLPHAVQQAAETTVGAVIAVLAVWLLVRWRRGLFHLHAHPHDGSFHLHGHTHPRASHAHWSRVGRSPLQAYVIGLIHGVGGSAGVGVLLLASIGDRAEAVVALALFAFFTAVSMALLSSGFGAALSSRTVRRSFARVAPVLGLSSLAFGIWYAMGALGLAPYFF